MASQRTFQEGLFFSLIRLSPILAPGLIIPVISEAPAEVETLLKAWLGLSATMIAWNMTEGSTILWTKAKAENSQKTKGYLLAVIICAAITLAMLAYLRSGISQGLFILLLATLSTRGISRTGWENNNPTAGFCGAIAGNALLTLISFRFIVPTLDWQSAACSLAIGTSVASVEASWYAHSFNHLRNARWPLPLFRASTCIGPFIITLLAFSHQLQASYGFTLGTVLAAGRLLKKTTDIPPTLLRGAAGIYVIFLTIMAICRLFESGGLR